MAGGWIVTVSRMRSNQTELRAYMDGCVSILLGVG